MAETMIERVAKAIQEQIPGWLREDGVNDEHLAIAAIKAMRDPSMHMIMAAHKHHEGEAWLPNSLFNSMIDAALSEGGE